MKNFLRRVILKSLFRSHRIFVEVYGELALSERTSQKWFARFKSGDFALERGTENTT